jgi:hypothetical protein
MLKVSESLICTNPLPSVPLVRVPLAIVKRMKRFLSACKHILVQIFRILDEGIGFHWNFGISSHH